MDAKIDRIEDPTAPPTAAEAEVRQADTPTEPTEGERSGATLFGVFYPKHFIVTIFRDAGAAESAAAALTQAGFAAGDVRTWSGAEVVANHDAYLEERGLLQKLGSLFPSEEHDVLNDYLEQARAGATFLTALAPDEAQRQTAAPILAEHGGALMRYYGDNTITNLTTDDRSNI